MAALLGGCGGGAASHSSTGPIARYRLRHQQVLARAGCSTAVAPAPSLSQVRRRFVRVPGAPFGIAVTPDGRWSFVDELGGRVAVLSDAGPVPRLVRTIEVPHDALGNSITRDGRYLLVADSIQGATVVSVARADAGAAHPVLGTLRQSRRVPGGGAIEVASSPDGRYAFVSIEYGGGVAVYDLRAALASGFRASGYVGSVPLGQAVVGMAVAPNGRWLYATSEVAAGARPLANVQGTLSVINLAEAERDPARSVAATVPAHCSPVRVAVSADGSMVWVTARESDQLLAFSAAKLIADPAHALLAAVRVGASPVGLALVDGGRRVVVADSNRFGTSREGTGLSVVDTAAALAGRPALVGTIRTGSFPREMALEPNGSALLIGDFSSDELEVVGVGGLR